MDTVGDYIEGLYRLKQLHFLSIKLKKVLSYLGVVFLNIVIVGFDSMQIV